MTADHPTREERQREARIAMWRAQILDYDRDDALTPLDALLSSFEADVRAAALVAADPAPAQPDAALTATDFAAVLRDESVRRVDDRYVHHAPIRDQMRDMADRIERWERGEFKPVPAPEVSRGVADHV